MVINILGEFPRLQHFVIGKGFPAIFGCIKRGIEHDAVRMQVWIKRAGSVMAEHGADDVSGQPFRFIHSPMNLCSGEVL